MVCSGKAQGWLAKVVRSLAVVAGANVVLLTQGVAADLSGRYDPDYEPPRYADSYRRPPPQYVPEPRYMPPPRYDGGPGYRPQGYYGPPSYKDDVPRDRYGRLRSFEDERRYTDRRIEERVYERREEACAPREVVHERLARQGWHDFHDPQLVGPMVLINARNEQGHPFILRIGRCSGEILAAERVYDRQERPYAWRAPPRDDRYRY